MLILLTLTWHFSKKKTLHYKINADGGPSPPEITRVLQNSLNGRALAALVKHVSNTDRREFGA